MASDRVTENYSLFSGVNRLVDEGAEDVVANAQTGGMAPGTPAELQVQQLWLWADAGWMRRLDAALAQWVVQHDAHCHPALPLVVALLSALEGRGHSCLELANVASQVPQWLDWPGDAPAQQALRSVLGQLPVTALAWQDVLRSPLVGPAPNQATVVGEPPPFVCAADAKGVPQRLYLRRYYLFEQATAQGLQARLWHKADGEEVSGAAAAQAWEGRVAGILAQLFPAREGAVPAFNWQKAACALALRQRLGVITGGPGTGKTYTAARLIAAALALADDPALLRIRLAAPTGKAAARLSESLQLAMRELPAAIQANGPLYQALGNIPAARTLHALLGARPGTRQLRHHAGEPLALDWLIVDEASMVDLEMMASLLNALPAHAHVVLLGDKDQLDSVEAGAVLGDICEGAEQGHYSLETARYLRHTCGQPLPDAVLQAPQEQPAPALSQAIAMLRESHRFGGMIGQLALAVQQGDNQAMATLMAQLQAMPAAERTVFWKEQASLNEAQAIATNASALAGQAVPAYGALAAAIKAAPRWPQAAASAGLADAGWLDTHAQWVHSTLEAVAQFRILCATRSGPWGVEGMNALVLDALQEAGVPVKRQGWFAGRVVMVTRNDASLGIFNGDVGIALPAAHNRQQLRVYFPSIAAASQAHEGPAVRSIAVSRMQHVETAFAMTVHKSQGSEFAHVLLCLPGHTSPLLTRELLYTGLTRAKQHFSYMSPHAGAWQQAMAQSTLRASGLVALLHQEQG